MALINDQSVEKRIRDRVLRSGIDVVVFDRSYRKKTCTDSVLRADPGSGQTPGFAHSTEFQLSPLHEDPCLLRIPLQSQLLRLQLRRTSSPKGISPSETSFPSVARAFAAAGEGVELAPPDWRPLPFQPPSLLEMLQFHLKAVKARAKPVAARLRLFAGQVAAYHAPQRLKTLIVRRYEKVVGSALLLATSLRQTKVKIRLTLPRVGIKLSSQQLMGLTGQGLIIASLVLLLMTLGPILRLQAGEWWNKSRTVITGRAMEPQIREVLTDTVRKPETIPAQDKQFQLLIPKLNANMKVIANVDAGKEKEYKEALAKGVAHAAGSGLPGEDNTNNKTIYIFGHSTNGLWNVARYNALFYSLKELASGDQIIVWFWGKEYRYVVEKVVKVDPLDLTYLEPQTQRDQLVLQTCWPPGTTWKRLLVIAVPVN